ncbi:ZNF91 protein, partial [Amia calva]|nr:ZNF91 protein [Amia calva]
AMQDQGRTIGFQCKQCDTVCPSWPSLLEHVESHYQHEEERRFKCNQCGRGYRHAGSLVNHKKTHEVGSFQCPVCQRELTNPLALKNHLRIHTPGKNFPCSVCGKAFRLATQLATHQKVHSLRGSPGKSRRCPAADERPDDSYALPGNSNSSGESQRNHAVNLDDAGTEKTNSDEDRPFKCNQCEKTYRHHGSLINHKKSHQLGAYECNVCYKQFTNLAALNSHLRIHTRSKSRPTAVPLSDPPTDSSVPQNGDAANFCHLCEVAFSSEAEFQDHILLHNNASLSLALPDDFSEDLSYEYGAGGSPDVDGYQPALNDSLLDNADSKGEAYDQDLSSVNGQLYTCAYCGEGYPDLDSLKEHYLTHDSGFQSEEVVADIKEEEPQRSEEEAVTVEESKANIAATTDQAESGERRFKCQLCGKSYRHAGSLINHKRSHQTGIYQCSICRKHYPHLAALKSHLRIHKSKPSILPLSTEGDDWLSPEPLTLEGQCYGFPFSTHGEENELDMPEDIGQGDSADDLESLEFPPFDSELAESAPTSPILPDTSFPVERHMCADCGETYADIAGIKAHQCPRRESMNGFVHNVDFQDLEEGVDHDHDLGHDDEDSQGPVGSKRRKCGPAQKRVDDFEDPEDYGEIYQCSVCGNRYSGLSALKSHMRCHTHPHDTPSNASRSSSVSTLDDEAKVESEEEEEEEGGLLICSTCGESFSNEQDKSHICGDCGVTCANYHELETHHCVHESATAAVEDEFDEEGDAGEEGKADPGLTAESPGSADRPHRCDQCGRAYRHAGSLLNHKKSHKTGVFRCFVCQKRFYNLLALKNHQRVHFDIKRHKCTECGKAFKIQKQLVNHQRIHEENRLRTKELNLQLQHLMQLNRAAMDPTADLPSLLQHSLAGGSNGTSSWLHANGEGVKLEKRPYSCDQCGRTYRHAGSLVNHKNSHKTGQYYCTICNNTYPNQLAMRNHLRLHFAVKKFVCAECGKAFRGQKQLSSHTQAHACRKKKAREAGRGRRASQGRKSSGGDSDGKLIPSTRCVVCDRNFPTVAEFSTHDCVTNPTRLLPAKVENGSPPAQIQSPEERPFGCDICGRTYRHAGSLLNHKNTHKTGSFNCSVCLKPFTNPMAMKNHLRIHTQGKRHICAECGKAFRLASALLNHQKVHFGDVQHRCPDCGKGFLGKSGLKRHRCRVRLAVVKHEAREQRGVVKMEKEPGSSDRRYTCEQCGRSYRHAGSLLNHKNTHTTGVYNCAVCLKEFSNLLALKNHSRIHSEAKRYKCLDCGKAFRVSSHLLSHRRVHTKERPYFCSPCQQGFSSKGSYKHHLTLHRTRPQDFANQRLAEDHGDGQPPSQDGGGGGPPFACDQCQSLFGTLAELQEHQEGHGGEKPHVCEHCGRTYRHAGSLLNHKNSHKTGSYSCAACQKEFSNLMALKNHRRIHTEPKRYKCPDCGKAFRVSTQLICHQRVHTKEKPFSCLQCGKSFSSKSNLRHHQKVHKARLGALGLDAPLDMGGSSLLGFSMDLLADC